jgi:hypothetical protein
MCFVRSQNEQRLSPYKTLADWLCITEEESVYSAVRTESFYKTDTFSLERVDSISFLHIYVPQLNKRLRCSARALLLARLKPVMQTQRQFHSYKQTGNSGRESASANCWKMGPSGLRKCLNWLHCVKNSSIVDTET